MGDATAQSLGIAHVVHLAIETDAHHAALLAHGLDGGGKLYLALVVAVGIGLLDVGSQLGKDVGRQDVLSEDWPWASPA